eukprot:Awhi_evm1s1162
MIHIIAKNNEIKFGRYVMSDDTPELSTSAFIDDLQVDFRGALVSFLPVCKHSITTQHNEKENDK